MAAAMAGFTMNDFITKLMSSEMNFGQVMLVRGLFAILLIGALAIHQGALRPLRTLFVTPVALRIVGEVGGTVAFLAAITHLPLANTSAIMQSLPLAITLGAALTLASRSAGGAGRRSWPASSAYSSSSGPASPASTSSPAGAGIGRVLFAAGSRD